MRAIESCLVLALAQLFAGIAWADNPVTWMIDETIQRTDSELTWTSPTAIDLGFDRYDYDYEITRILATVLFATVDVTEEVGGAFDLVSSGSTDSLPVVLVDAPLDDPTTGTMADVKIEVGADGFGRASFTDVVLGTAPVGNLRFNIESIRVEATVTLTGIDFAPGDYNRDGTVDLADYTLWSADYGATDRPAADGNEDGRVDAADYTIWRDNVTAAAAPVPEPATGMLLALCVAAWGCRNAGRPTAE